MLWTTLEKESEELRATRKVSTSCWFWWFLERRRFGSRWETASDWRLRVRDIRSGGPKSRLDTNILVSSQALQQALGNHVGASPYETSISRVVFATSFGRLAASDAGDDFVWRWIAHTTTREDTKDTSTTKECGRLIWYYISTIIVYLQYDLAPTKPFLVLMMTLIESQIASIEGLKLLEERTGTKSKRPPTSHTLRSTCQNAQCFWISDSMSIKIDTFAHFLWTTILARNTSCALIAATRDFVKGRDRQYQEMLSWESARK